MREDKRFIAIENHKEHNGITKFTRKSIVGFV